MQGLGAHEVLRRVVQVQEEPRDHRHSSGLQKRYSLHGLASQVTYQLRDEMAHTIAAENRIVSLLATCYQNQIESVLTCRASYRVALLDEDSVAQQASPGPPLPF